MHRPSQAATSGGGCALVGRWRLGGLFTGGDGFRKSNLSRLGVNAAIALATSSCLIFGELRVHPCAKAFVIVATSMVEALDVALEEPAAQFLFLHRDDLVQEQRIERAQNVIRLLDQLNVAVGQR